MERDNHVHWIGSVSIVKMSVLSKLIYTEVQCNRSKYLNRAVAAAAAGFFSFWIGWFSNLYGKAQGQEWQRQS